MEGFDAREYRGIVMCNESYMCKDDSCDIMASHIDLVGLLWRRKSGICKSISSSIRVLTSTTTTRPSLHHISSYIMSNIAD